MDWPDPASVAQFNRGEGPEPPRWYKHLRDGWEFPGVTTVLKVWDKGGLMNWAADQEREAVLAAASQLHGILQEKKRKISVDQFRATVEGAIGVERQHIKARDKAASIGTGAHDRFSWEMRKRLGEDPGPPPVLGKESMLAYSAAIGHFDKCKLRPVRTEQPVYSLTHGYAGTGDLFCLDEHDRLGYTDLKTSKRIYPSQHLQAVAYCEAAEELIGAPVEWCQVWRMPKSTDDLRFEVADLGDLRVWNGRESVKKSVSRRALLESFLGIHKAWFVTCTGE